MNKLDYVFDVISFDNGPREVLFTSNSAVECKEWINRSGRNYGIEDESPYRYYVVVADIDRLDYVVFNRSFLYFRDALSYVREFDRDEYYIEFHSC